MALRLLAISGSLRAGSSNSAILEAAALLAPPGMVVTQYCDLGHLPHFNPDLQDPLPALVAELYARVSAADGLLISAPEYARGIPGSFKNALDWLVGSLDFAGKPVALINTSPRASEAQAALRLVLTTMAARLVEEASFSVDLLAKNRDAAAIAADATVAPQLAAALRAFAVAIAR